MSDTILNSRKFVVKGHIIASFTPESTEYQENISNFEVELWQKRPLDVFFLGKGTTNDAGEFTIPFEVKDDSRFIRGGVIENIFAKVYFQGIIVSGENPYTTSDPSLRPIKDISLKEGLTDIGSYTIDITNFEFPVNTDTDTPQLADATAARNSILFEIKEGGDEKLPLPVGYTCSFEGTLPNVWRTFFTISSHTIKEGYAEVIVPPIPVSIKTGDEFIVNTKINGAPESPTENIYLEVASPDLSSIFYTQISTFVVYNGRLCVYSNGEYYPTAHTPINLENVTRIGIDPDGAIYTYNEVLDQWSLHPKWTFYQIQYPENLTFFADGIYEADLSAGKITPGQLGDGIFEPFSISVENPGIFPIGINLKVSDPEDDEVFFSNFIGDLLPGSKDLAMVYTSDYPKVVPASPSISDIELIIRKDFPVALVNFLNTSDLGTLDKLKNAGPVRYIDGLPATEESDLTLLQAHVDLYTVCQDSAKNQSIIDLGFDNLYKIAQTPKDVFWDIIYDAEFTLYEAMKLHDTVVQNQKLLTNLLTSKLGDYELKTPFIPDLPNSSFAQTAFSKFINRCECEDCTSAVSPFSYLVDLLKYGAKHIKKTGSPSYTPINYNAFLTLMENYFFQPFGSFSVDCETLHKEYCRLRLVTEILEQYVATKTLPEEVRDRLENTRSNFILLTYKSLLTQAGSSFEELRNVMTSYPGEDKNEAALKFSNKLGIPLYIPGSTDLTADRMWLTFGNPIPGQKLNAENLEIIFGFRDTKRDVLTNPAESLIISWKNTYLLELWKETDYLSSSYSREDVVPATDSTYKATWKPIIDPDIIGRGDLTYKSSEFALDLWRHRKQNTDEFLNDFVTNSNILSRTSVDMSARRLRVPGMNLAGVVFRNNEIRLQGADAGMVSFEVFSVLVNGTDTDILLKKSTTDSPQPEIFQPSPIMLFDSVIPVADLEGESSFEVILAGAPLISTSPIERIQLTSTGNPNVYSTDPNTPVEYRLSLGAITVGASETRVALSLDSSGELPPDFQEGNISFICEMTAELNTVEIPDPEKICDQLYTVYFPYNYLLPAPAGMGSSFSYTLWDYPAEWPTGAGSESSNYLNLKKLYEVVRSGTEQELCSHIVMNEFRTDFFGFNLFMETLIGYEQYLNAMYSAEQPSQEKMYQAASILRNSGRTKLNANWVKEEIKHIPTGGTEPEKLMLESRFFWKALNEPSRGVWDPSLQTIPANVSQINASHVPIIDPELVDKQQLLISPDAKRYLALYDFRQEQLDNQKDFYFSRLFPFEAEGFRLILNHLNTGDQYMDYNISPYNNIGELISDFEGNDAFKKLKATQVLREAFGLTAEEFTAIIPIMNAYEDDNPTNQPTTIELHQVVSLFVAACKRKRFYISNSSGMGWIEQEISGDFPNGIDGIPVKYYNVFKLRLDAVRGNTLNRSEWQQTLAKWNRVPTVFPDIVPPENINQFIQGQVVHDLWIARKDELDFTYDGLVTLFNDSLGFQQLLDNYTGVILNVIVAREGDTSPSNYYTYFTELFDKEDAGEDIRPYLNQLNVLISEYRVLRQVYFVLKNGAETTPASPSNMLASEFESVLNIAVRIAVANGRYFTFVKEEYESGVVLSGNDFQNYTPAIINFPLNLVTETEQWRSPNAAKKAWKDTLNTRIERKEKVHEEWNEAIEATEDITIQLMRDGLIEALRSNCESFDQAAERLAKTLFIETKDNCCVKHSRVSHAIETMQGLVFALESGVYDNYLTGFSFTAPNFDKEWQWLGSYATWRSAVFTYIYPENLLYPTLKRKQSPAFIELAETVQNANRFTPNDACKAAKKYQGYFDDIQNLKLVCTTNADAYIFRNNPLDCCGDTNNSMSEYMTFYFGQSRLTGKAYYSEKKFYSADPNDQEFWREIPLRKNATLLGCLPLSTQFEGTGGKATETALWLFYSFREEGKLKLGYLKKDLLTAGSEWTEEETLDLPDPAKTKLPSIDSSDELSAITICQNSIDWDFVYFLFTYKRSDGKLRHVQIRYFAKDAYFDLALNNVLLFESFTYPLTAVRHQVRGEALNAPELTGITVLFENEIQTARYDPGSSAAVITTFSNVIGAFKKDQSDYHFILANRDSSGQTKYTEIDCTYSDLEHLKLYKRVLNPDSLNKNVVSIAPRFNASKWESANGVTLYNQDILAGVTFRRDMSNLGSAVVFALAPEKRVAVQIESGECIDNFDLRTANIKEHMRANLNAPQGNPIGSLYRTNNVKEMLYEAYYFVPMLLALDQQQRGEFPAALDWYRSVYDYTNNLAHKRKVFYGLVLEQSLVNVTDRPADWLLDPLNPHLIAQTRPNTYTKYTLMNIVQCMTAYGDREYTIDTIETVPNARKLYTEVLNLLKVSELNVKPSQCYTASHACFETAVAAPMDSYWSNALIELQTELESLNDVALIEEATEELATIFDENSQAQTKFTNAFTYLSELKALNPAPGADTVTGLMDGIGNRMNDAYRYLFAGISTKSFNQVVETRFTNTLAVLSSTTPDQIMIPGNEEQISWMKNPVPDNTKSLEFRFANEYGQQLLKKDFAFNPFQPTAAAFQGNLVFANASVLYEPFLYAEDYMPFVDYAFCLPTNPVYAALELKANLELFKIHNCRNIAGMERSLDIFAAPTDSVSGVPVIGAGGNLILPGKTNLVPSQYRFRILMERAKQLVAQAQQLESQFLSTLEKEDAENYNQLRARQDLQTAKATVKLQDMRVKQAQNEKESADLQLQKVQFIQNTYSGWLSAGLNEYEEISINSMKAAKNFKMAVSIAGLAASATAADPRSSAAAVMSAVLSGLSAIAEVETLTANYNAQLASFERREQEWQYQSDLAGYDVSLANQQIKMAEQNTRIVSQEREIASMNMDHATDTLEFLKTKFTNAELYRWMGNVLERTYSYMLSLATSVARTAEQQYYFEQQELAGPFILNDYWEVPQTGGLALNGGNVDRRGMTGSARLLQDITRLDQFAFESTKRKLQMTKVISLGQHFPEALQTFRETGVLNFDLTNRMFDYDFPGHYLRLINGVKVSVIGLLPVYDSIKATLTAGTTSYTVIETNNTFQRIPIRRMETEQVALTGASRANGMFLEFQQMQNEFLNPFEGMGVESRWEFKMPRFSNRMDYNQIADVVVEVDYTALDNYQYRYQVLQDIDNTLGFSRGVSFKNDFPDQWYELAQVQEENTPFAVEFELKREMFPQGVENIRLDGSDILLHFARKDGFTEEVMIADFSLVTGGNNAQPMDGITVNGNFKATALSNVLSAQSPAAPFVKLRLAFANTPINRELFSEENVTDILLLVNCKADLPVYPL